MQAASDISEAVQHAVRVLNLPAAAPQSAVDGSDVDDVPLGDLLQVLGASKALKGIQDKHLPVRALKRMSAMEMVQFGVADISELEAVMDAVQSLAA